MYVFPVLNASLRVRTAGMLIFFAASCQRWRSWVTVPVPRVLLPCQAPFTADPQTFPFRPSSYASCLFCQQTESDHSFSDSIPVRPHFFSVSTRGSDCSCCTQHSQWSLLFLLSVHREVTTVSVRNIHSQASCLFCQRTGSDHSSCVQHSQSSLMSLLSAHKKWPQFLCTASSQACHVGLTLHELTENDPSSHVQHSVRPVMWVSCLKWLVPSRACNVGFTSHLHWRCAFACDGACPSLTCSFNRGNTEGTFENLCFMFVYVYVCGETGFVDQLEKGFIYEKSSEICICLCWGLIVLRWPCAVDRMLKSSY